MVWIPFTADFLKDYVSFLFFGWGKNMFGKYLN